MTELKPCRKCGANAMIVEMDGDINRVHVICSNNCSEALHKAINKWNTRSTPTFTKEDVEKAAVALIIDDYVSMEDYWLATAGDDYELYERAAGAALSAVGKVDE